MWIPAEDYYSGQAMAAPYPVLKACLSARRGVVQGEKLEVPGLMDLTCPLCPSCLGWLCRVSL